VTSERITDEVVLLWVARETGVLEALLSSAGTVEAVARRAGIPDRGARVITRALTERGFFEEVEGEYEPTNRVLGFLARRDTRSIGSLPHRVDGLERILDLPAALDGRRRPPPRTVRTRGDPGAARPRDHRRRRRLRGTVIPGVGGGGRVRGGRPPVDPGNGADGGGGDPPGPVVRSNGVGRRPVSRQAIH